jgi:Type IV secretion system pilin
MELILRFAAATCGPGVGTNPYGLPETCATNNEIQTAFYVGFGIIGGLAFLFLVIAGIRYVFSKGEPDAVQKAKNEIKYCLIGLLIAAFGAAAVNIIVGKF